jgi:threonine/homoserine/homoserine lactone efflux protein
VSLEFSLTTLIIVATPGTGKIYTMATGLGRDARSAMIAAFACTLGIAPRIVAASLGLLAARRALTER